MSLRGMLWRSLCPLLASAALFGCSDDPTPKGRLMLSLQTDMAPPKDIDSVRIEVFVAGALKYSNDVKPGPDGLKIPATLAIIGGNDPGAEVAIRIIAFKAPDAQSEPVARVLNELVTTVPPGKVSLVRVPIQWLCFGMVSPHDDQGRPSGTSVCDKEQTCKAGSCQTSHVNATELLTYADALVFGGGSAAGEGTCFDTVSCFVNGVGAAVNLQNCTMPHPQGGAGTNVALVLPTGGAGICSNDACFIPFDGESTYGWQTNAEGSISLPTAVCEKLKSHEILGVAVTTSCQTKGENIPTCGPWSSVGSGIINGSQDTLGVHPPVDAGSTSDASDERSRVDGGDVSPIDASAEVSSDASEAGGSLCGTISSGRPLCDLCNNAFCCGQARACSNNDKCLKAGTCALQCAYLGTDCTALCENMYSSDDNTFGTYYGCLQNNCKSVCFPSEAGTSEAGSTADAGAEGGAVADDAQSQTTSVSADGGGGSP